MRPQRLGHDWATFSAAKSLHSCPTLCDPIDGSPLGSAIPGILQARTLEWVAISFSRDFLYTTTKPNLSKLTPIWWEFHQSVRPAWITALYSLCLHFTLRFSFLWKATFWDITIQNESTEGSKQNGKEYLDSIKDTKQIETNNKTQVHKWE